MKVIVCLVAFVFVCVNANVVADQKKTKSQEHIDFCTKEIGVDESVAKKLTLGDFSNHDEKAKCFVNCFFKRAGFLNEKNEPQKDVIIEKLTLKTGLQNEKFDELITKCIAVKGADQCETSYKIYECYWINQSAEIKAATVGNPVDQYKAKAQEHIDFCTKDIGVDESVAKKLKVGDFLNLDPKAQCFINCFFKRSGFFNEKDEPQKDVIIEKFALKTGLKKEKFDDLVTKCIAVKGADQCETSFKIYECYWKNQSDEIKAAITAHQ